MQLNPFTKINKEIEKLKEQVYGKEKKITSFFYFPLFNYEPATLKDDVDSIGRRVGRLEKEFSLLLKHLDIEYVKITEENGSKKEVEKYRKIKKVKAKKVQEEDED